MIAGKTGRVRTGKPLMIILAVGTAAVAGVIGYRIIRKQRARAHPADAGRGEARNTAGQVASLAEHWHSLDGETKKGHIPKDLAREPKDVEQRAHG
jgi:hypothetical protein